MINRIFKDIQFDMSKSAVARNATGEQVKDSRNELVFSTEISDTDFEDLAYTFKNDRLQKIAYTAYVASAGTANKLHAALLDEFNTHYTKVGKLWDGKLDNTDFTVFLKKTQINSKDAVIAIFEKR